MALCCLHLVAAGPGVCRWCLAPVVCPLLLLLLLMAVVLAVVAPSRLLLLLLVVCCCCLGPRL